MFFFREGDCDIGQRRVGIRETMKHASERSNLELQTRPGVGREPEKLGREAVTQEHRLIETVAGFTHNRTKRYAPEVR